MTNNESELHERDSEHPLVFYLEVLRKTCGKHAFTQEDLAMMSGVARLRIGRYERAHEVPRVLRDLVALSYALGLPTVEALIAPEAREAILAEVDEYRDVRGLAPLRPQHSPAIGFRPDAAC